METMETRIPTRQPSCLHLPRLVQAMESRTWRSQPIGFDLPRLAQTCPEHGIRDFQMLALLPRVHAGWLVGNFVNMSGPGVPCALAQAELLVGTSQSFDGIAMSPVPALDVVFCRSAISRCGEGCADLKRLRPGLISAAGDTVAQQKKCR